MSHDAIVIGGGPAGATVALLLARSGWSVALVERSEFPRRKVCGEFISASTLGILESLDVGRAVRGRAGPEIRRVGIFAGETRVVAAMPVPRAGVTQWGRALGREHLDTLLVAQAAAAGAEILQPWTVTELDQDAYGVCCRLQSRNGSRRIDLQGRIAIAAQGSWDRGDLPGQIGRDASSPEDLFGFKANFHGASLEPDLMPLLAFPGGYGGMVSSDDDRLSLSFCVRRDRLPECRRRSPGRGAGESVLAHIRSHCRAADCVLDGARMVDPWLAVGPLRPGFRALRQGRVFLCGNAAGEAHPVIAEGISLAIQSSWLLAEALQAHRDEVLHGAVERAGDRYATAWRRQFAARIRRSALIARLSMQPAAAAIAPLFSLFPGALTECARLSGKTRLLAV